MIKRAVESGEVIISAVRHKKPRAKSEPNLTAAVMAELAADTNYYSENHEAGERPKQSKDPQWHHSGHEKDIKMASANMSRISCPEYFSVSGDKKENVPEFSFSKAAELKLNRLEKCTKPKPEVNIQRHTLVELKIVILV